jgi:hypothetical protein
MEGKTINHEMFLQPIDPGGSILTPGIRDALSDRIHACLLRPMQDIRARQREFPSEFIQKNLAKQPEIDWRSPPLAWHGAPGPPWGCRITGRCANNCGKP